MFTAAVGMAEKEPIVQLEGWAWGGGGSRPGTDLPLRCSCRRRTPKPPLPRPDWTGARTLPLRTGTLCCGPWTLLRPVPGTRGDI